MGAPALVLDLVERFDRNVDAYRSGSYNETQVRREFIDPFFKALGWDIDNEAGYAPAYKDVVHEDAIKVGGLTKAPDYCFRVGGSRKFFVEAKKPAVNLRDDASPAFQLRRYAWSANSRNPCDLVDPPRAQVEMHALDEDGLLALLAAVRGTRLCLPTLLAAVTGMRRGELLALRWPDVDPETGECRVARSLQETPEGVGFKAPKTGKGRRTVLLPRLALAALKAHRAVQNEEKLLLGPGYQDQDLILARADGTPWPPPRSSPASSPVWPASMASPSAFTICATRTLPICSRPGCRSRS